MGLEASLCWTMSTLCSRLDIILEKRSGKFGSETLNYPRNLSKINVWSLDDEVTMTACVIIFHVEI